MNQLYVTSKHFFKLKTKNIPHLTLTNRHFIVIWHAKGLLFRKFGSRLVYDTASTYAARLSSVPQEGFWTWNEARSDELVRIQSHLFEVKSVKLCLLASLINSVHELRLEKLVEQKSQKQIGGN